MSLQNGRIDRIDPHLRVPSQTPLLKANGRLLLPAALDGHVHFRTPGAEHKETLLSGTQAAVQGGVALCADMPNTMPRTTTLQALQQKIHLAQGAPCHLLFHFGAEADNLDQVRQAAKLDCVKALKIYMGPSTGQGGLAPEHVEKHFANAADIGLPVIVHAEDLEWIVSHAQEEANPDVKAHHRLRGLQAELNAVSQALEWATRYQAKLHLAHSTSAQVVELAAKSGLGKNVLVEACPHHLALSVEDIAPPQENRYKVNPPLRPRSEQQALFACLPKGIDCLASDHAPHTLQEKQTPYAQAPSGIPGVEHLFPLGITWWQQGKISLERLIDLSSANLARFWGLNKGVVAEQADADLVLLDPHKNWRIGRGEEGRIASKCAWSVYDGWEMRGKIEATIVSGKVVYSAM